MILSEDDLPSIRDLVREGDELLVQVVKDPLGNKGARLTRFITLPARHLVLLPDGDTVGISRRALKTRMSASGCAASLRSCSRSAASSAARLCAPWPKGSDKASLAADLKYLTKLWEVVQERCRKKKVKTLIHEDLSLPLRVLRDLVTSDVENISS